MTRSFHLKANRRHLLAGISPLIVAVALSPSAALAQTGANGQTVITTIQRTQNSPILASRSNAPVSIHTGDLTDTVIGATDMTLEIKAGANSASSDLTGVPDTPASASSSGSVDGGTVAAGASLAIANQQAVRGGSVASTITGGSTLSTGNLSSSTATIARDLSSADSFGNANAAIIRDDGGVGATIVSSQSVAATPISSTLTDRVATTAGAVDNGRIGMDGNGQHSTVAGNISDLGLGATVGGVDPDGVDRTTVVLEDGASVRAAELLLQRQTISGATSAIAGTPVAPAGSLASVATLNHGTIAVSADRLNADAAGNRATALLDIAGTTIVHDGSVSGSVIAQVADGDVTATTYGGSGALVAGALDTSSLSLSGNGVGTTARGNVASNAMTVNAAGTTASTGPVSGPVGTALTEPFGARSTSGAFTVHTDQVSGAVDIGAVQRNGEAIVDLGGTVAGATVTLTGNTATADVAANEGRSSLTLQVPAFASSADLLSFQSGDANVRALVGESDVPAGATIVPALRVDGSLLTIDANTLHADAMGNRATNALTLAGASVSDGGDHPISTAGTLEDGYGGSATLALSSFQKVGNPSLSRPTIDAEILGRFSVTGNGGARGSTIAITGNHQQASAGANSADNSVALTAASTGNAGTALSSSQFGHAQLTATASFKAVAPGALDASQASITGNSNAATATMNDAANSLAVTGSEISSPVTATLATDPLAGALARGDYVLSNSQFADGSVTANARMLFAGSAGDVLLTQPGMNGSSFAITGNSSSAEATGNRALSTGSFTGDLTGGIASSQMNVASVSSRSDANLLLDTASPGSAIASSSVDVTGNTSAALARGNVAENRIDVAWTRNIIAPASAVAGPYSASATAPVALASTQSNYGPINAVASFCRSTRPACPWKRRASRLAAMRTPPPPMAMAPRTSSPPCRVSSPPPAW